MPVRWILPATSMNTVPAPLTMIVGDVVTRQQRFQGAVAEHVVADVVEQLFLLGDRHHEFLIAMISLTMSRIPRARTAVQLGGELGEVDRLYQAPKMVALT